MNRHLLTFAVILSALSLATGGPGESAVITLVFPPGARATGMGETFVAIADDINATYFNPAGLGQAPLANSWRTYLESDGVRLTAITARKRRAFDIRQEIWAGTSTGVLLYNGKSWSGHSPYIVETGDTFESIVRRHLDNVDEERMRRAVMAIRRENDLGMKGYERLVTLLEKELTDTLETGELAPSLAYRLISLESFDRTTARIYGLIAARVDSARADTVTGLIMETLSQPGRTLDDIVELKVPFALAFEDSVTALALDDSDRLWVGTAGGGVWRYDGTRWQPSTMLDGLPSNHITSLAVGRWGEVLAGTDRGVAVLKHGTWRAHPSGDGLPEDATVTAVAFGRDSILYVGTPDGLHSYDGARWTTLDTTDGMLSNSVTALLFDSENRLWIGGPQGVTIRDATSWRRYRFPDSHVFRITEYQQGVFWIGTNRGAIAYKGGRRRTGEGGVAVEDPPTWKVFHSRNALSGDEVYDICVHGRDVWLITEKGVNQYHVAQRQAFSFWEPLLPQFGIRDLWHLYAAYVHPTEDWGTLGFSVNYINMGENEWTDELGRELGTVRSWEAVFGLSYGLGITGDFSLGLNAKYVQSNLAPGIGKGDEGVGRTFAIDAALLKRNFIRPRLDFGFMLQNMGPSIFYISRDQSDPIPFTVKAGVNYGFLETPVHDLRAALDLNREIVKNYFDQRPDPFWKAIYTDLFVIDGYDTLETDEERSRARWEHTKEQFQEIQIHAGVEYWYVDFLALRSGFLFDWLGERYEWTFGFGVKYGNLNVDWSYIYSPEGFLKRPLRAISREKEGATGARDGQWRISLIGRF